MAKSIVATPMKSLLPYFKRYQGEAKYIFSSIIAPVVSMIGSVVASMFIDPTDMGIITNTVLIATYVNFLQLGVFNGLNRNIAYYKAKRNFVIVQESVNTSHFIALLVSGVGLIIGVCYGLHIKDHGLIYLLSVVLLVSNLIFSPLTTHYETTYRSGQEFERLANIKFKESLLYSIVIFLPALLGAIGKIISDSIKSIFGYFLRKNDAPIKATGTGSMACYKNLVYTGFPMLIGGYLWSVFQVADQTCISLRFGVEELGMYTLSRYCIIAFMMIPSAINSVLYPKASTTFGQTGDVNSLLTFWKKSILMYLVVIIPTVILLYFIAPLLVPIFLPKYVDGIECMKINLIACASFIYMGPSVIFGTIKKNFAYILLISFCLGGFWLLALLLPEIFNTPARIAWLRLAFSYLLSIGAIVISYLYIRQ